MACGEVDGYWEITLQPYDIAAGVIIAREAGAVVTDLFGKDEFPAKGFLCTNGRIHEKCFLFFMITRIYNAEIIADLSCYKGSTPVFLDKVSSGIQTVPLGLCGSVAFPGGVLAFAICKHVFPVVKLSP